MKPRNSLKLMIVLLSLGLIFSQCQHTDEEIVPNGSNPPSIERGDATVNDDPANPDDFNFDKAHSNVRWETYYKGSGALLTGRFNSFGVTKFEFQEDDPSQIAIEAWVKLNTVNTGEPGRDGGCLLSTFGTAAEYDEEPENLATIKSTSVAFSQTDAGYIITADLTFHGVTDEITMKLDFVGITFLESSSQNMAGFQGEFSFDAKSVFGIESSNISDNVVVKINVQLKDDL